MGDTIGGKVMNHNQVYVADDPGVRKLPELTNG
jgi:hypothetical protein